MAKFFYAIGVLFCLYFLAVCASTAGRQETAEKKRDGRLSDEEHYHKDGEHNQEYDHETFLGKEKKTYDQLTPDESKDRLGKIVDKIDKDHNGNITEEELAAWVSLARKQNLYKTADTHWLDLKRREENYMSHGMKGSAKKKVDVNEPVEWEKYKTINYGISPETSDVYKEQVQQDERRWKSADLDKDNRLSRKEYASMIQPWDFEHMRDAVVAETVEEVDKDHDGLISLDEYLGHLYGNRNGERELDEVELKNQKEYFSRGLDKNKDSKMDKDEVKEWLFPIGYDFATADARHLSSQADVNKDKVLTKGEILEKYNVFVGSRATNYGEDLTRHDEF